MFSFLLAVQILVSVAIITLVLLQQGKGADMGAAFGSGASATVFGARGSGSFFTRATGILAAVFFVNCLLIASPLVRTGNNETSNIASQLEEKARAEQLLSDEAALVKKLEEASATLDGAAATTGQANDLPGRTAVDTAPDASDLPEYPRDP